MTDVHPATQLLIVAALIQFWFLPLGAWWMLGRRHDLNARLWFGGTAVYALTASLYAVSWRWPGSLASLGVVTASSLSVILLIEAMRRESSTRPTPWSAYGWILGLEMALQLQQFQPGVPTSALTRGTHLGVLAVLDITLMVFVWRAYQQWRSLSLLVIGAMFALFAASNVWRVVELASSTAAPGLLDFRGSGQLALLLNLLSVVFYSFGYWGFVLDKSMQKEVLATQERIATEQREALVEEMSRLGRMAQGGALSASIAHEVNQPLAAMHLGIDTVLDLMRHMPAGPWEPMRPMLERVRHDAARVHEVITRVQAMFRQSPAQKSLHDLHQIVARVVDLSASRLKAHEVMVQVRPGALPSVWLIPGEIEHIILNLVDNAIHALSQSPRPRRVIIDTRLTEQGDIQLQVSDNGPGIDPALRPYVFDLAVTGRTEGTGMGLWLARYIAERHGGTLTLAPSPEAGTTLTLRLPSATQPPHSV